MKHIVLHWQNLFNFLLAFLQKKKRGSHSHCSYCCSDTPGSRVTAGSRVMAVLFLLCHANISKLAQNEFLVLQVTDVLALLVLNKRHHTNGLCEIRCSKMWIITLQNMVTLKKGFTQYTGQRKLHCECTVLAQWCTYTMNNKAWESGARWQKP